MLHSFIMAWRKMLLQNLMNAASIIAIDKPVGRHPVTTRRTVIAAAGRCDVMVTGLAYDPQKS